MTDNRNLVDQLLVVLHATLSPESVKTAQEKLENLASYEGFARSLLDIMSDDRTPAHIRNSAAVSLKNFVRANWADGDAPLPETEREDLRNALLLRAFQVPAFLREQVSEIVCQISRIDFPEKWPQLKEVIAAQLGNFSFDQHVAALTILDQLVIRYRHEMRSDTLWTEIILVVNSVAEPLTLLYQRMLEYAISSFQGSTDPLSPTDRSSWLQIMLLVTRIYHSLVAQDISPYFEDNLAVWMKGFIALLKVVLPVSLDRSQSDLEPSDLERLKTEICDVATLFSQRFEDLFGEYTQEFIEIIWQLLNVTDSKIRFDSFVNSALGFLAAICQRPHYKIIFEAEGVLKGICDGVIIKNLMLRPEDVEIYDSEPFEFFKRDIEGSDLETRRRGATDFVRALCKQFEPQVFTILSDSISTFLNEYAQDPVRNFTKKDVVYFLVSAMAARGTTTRYGSVTTSQLIDVSNFYTQYVREDLIEGGPDDRPLLRGDALKYLVLFRSKLAPEQIIECVRGAPSSEPPSPTCSIIRFLSSRFIILHHYLAYTLERLFLLRSPGTGIWHQASLLTAENIPLSDIIESLFKCFESPSAYETHYLMKALMRSFTIINDEMAKNAHLYVQRLTNMIDDAIRVPKNPLFIHNVFESLCVLIKKAYSKVDGGIDKYIIPVVEAIITNDIADLTAYALQLIALLLDQSQTERQRGITVSQDQYKNFFPTLVRPDLWSRSANFPALVRIFESFVRCIPELVFQPPNCDQVMGILQKLISSKAHDVHGFRLANAFIKHLDQFTGSRLTSRDVLLAMLTRLNQAKTTKCTRQFVLFVFRFSAIRGGELFARTLDAIQLGLFNMVVEKLLIAEIRQMPQTTTHEEKRIVAVGATALIILMNDRVALPGSLYSQMVESVVSLLEAFQQKSPTTEEGMPPTSSIAGNIFMAAHDDQSDLHELEYTDPYCKLSFAIHSDPFFPNIQNVKKHFAQAISPESLTCINDRVKNILHGYLSS